MIKNTKQKNKGVQLITYADSLGCNLQDLDFVLDNYLHDIVKGVHILPFYPSSSDRGFAPLSHRQVDPHFGTFEDIEKISSKYELMADLIVNHVSSESKYFRDYLRHGDHSKYHDFFIEARRFARRFYKIPKNKYWQKVFFGLGQISTFLRNLDFIFHKQGVNRLVLKKIYRPRPGSPFVSFQRQDGSKRYLFCTFSKDQIDLNTKSPAVKRKLKRDILHLKKLGIKYIRLDAVAYAIKRRGTSNFLLPETAEFITWLAGLAHEYDIKVLPEVHHHYKTQELLSKIAGVDYIYDFALPFLTLQALDKGDGSYLKKWIKLRPDNSISTLDTHDGIGVVDVEGLLPPGEIERIHNKILETGGNAAMRASGGNAENVDIYQINCTYYSALREDDKAYLAARAIQLFLPGIPQIYYVGLLAGKNDKGLLNKTNIGRDINRHYYSLPEIERELKRKVVQKLFSMCRLRNTHRAFDGDFELLDSNKEEIIIRWKSKNHTLQLNVNLHTKEISINAQ